MTHDEASQPEARPRVLVIDDLVDVHRLISVRLRAEGLDFFGALTGEDGLAKAASELPALILLDLELGSVHGLTVLKGLKASATTQDIPVIIISGNQHAHEKVKAFDLGAVDYVTKPFEMTELRVRIRQALKMRHLVQMLAQRAQVDGLTGLWNRAFFNKRWAEEVERSARHGHTLSVAMLDIDHFKSINDTYGHSAGDAALQGVAKIIQRCCRNHDLVCRFGGEEFVIVMPETCPADAAIMGERIRHAIELEEWPRHPQRRLTASIGICGTTSATVGSAESIVEQADQNLYKGKHSGRNRVIWTDWKAPPAVGGMAA